MDHRPEAIEEWRWRVWRVGSAIQGGFAALWLGQGAEAVLDLRAGIAVGSVAGLLTLAGVFVTRGAAPRPKGKEAAAIERDVTVATVLQLAASFAAPEWFKLAGRAELALPSVVLSVAVLLAFLGVRVRSRALLVGGVALGGTDLTLALLLPRGVVASYAGLICGALQLAIALEGFVSLRGIAKVKSAARVLLDAYAPEIEIPLASRVRPDEVSR